VPVIQRKDQVRPILVKELMIMLAKRQTVQKRQLRKARPILANVNVHNRFPLL
jgi:hypothetical protein